MSEREPTHDQLRALPQVGAVLGRDEVAPLVDAYGAAAVTAAVRAEIARARAAILAGGGAACDVSPAALRAALERRRATTLRPVINAAGVLVHTNLGRAPLAPAALEAAQAVSASYASLELDLDGGGRGSRHDHVRGLLTTLCEAEDAVVVNNGAGAVLIALAALATGRPVVISRGELVEIGGGFRIPDVMEQSGARLWEVGTTNRTHPGDFERALAEAPDVAALLKVHRSNFAVVGFTREVDVGTLSAIATAARVPLVVDAGSGCLARLPACPDEEPVAALIARGADLVTFSGDKLLGGPQAGIVVGRADLVDKIRRHPLMRALRPDKLCLAALAETLTLWRDKPEAVPLYRMLAQPVDDKRRRAEAIVADLGHPAARAVPTEARIGGGTSPQVTLPSWAVAVEVAHAGRFQARLRQHDPPVIARIDDDRVLLDLSAVFPEQDGALVAALRAAVHDEAAP